MIEIKAMLDEYAKVPLYQYQVDLLAKIVKAKGSFILVSTPRNTKDNFFMVLFREEGWRARVRKLRQREKVQFT